MKKHLNVRNLVITSIVLLSVITYLRYSQGVASDLKKLIQDNLPNHIELKYKTLSVSLLSGSFELDKAQVFFKDRGVSLFFPKIEVNGINLREVIVNNNVEIKKVSFEEAKIVVDPTTKKKVENHELKQNLTIKIGRLESTIKELVLRDKKGESTLEIKNSGLNFTDLRVKTQASFNEEKLSYKQRFFETDSLYIPLSEEREFFISKLKVDSRSADIKDAKIKLEDQGVSLVFKQLKIDEVDLETVLKKDTIVIDEVFLSQALLKIDKHTNTSKIKRKPIGENKQVIIKKLKVKDAAFDMVNEKGEDKGGFSGATARFKNVTFNTVKKEWDFNLENIEADKLYYKLDEKLHKLSISKLKADRENMVLLGVEMKPSYSKEEFERQLFEQADMLTLSVPEIRIEHYKIANKAKYIKAENVKVIKPNLWVYRDKSLPKPVKEKPLYSTMLRNMKTQLDIEKMDIQKAVITYEENVNGGSKSGKIFFKNLNAEIENLQNINPQKDRVDVKVESQFMGKALVNIDWYFYVYNPQDFFNIKGELTHLAAQDLNPFFINNLNLSAKGMVKKVHFDFSGNNAGAYGEMAMDYSHFSVELLTKKNKKTRGFWSIIANWVLQHKESKQQNVNHPIQVKRDPHKSFFNLFWKCLRLGLKENILKKK